MNITTEADITAEALKELRKQSGEIQRSFWARVGVTQAGGSRYESGQIPLPKPLRLLVFANYVAGLDLDSSTEEGGAKVIAMGKAFNSKQ